MDSKYIEIIPHIDQSKDLRDHGASAKYKGEDCRVIEYTGPLAQQSDGYNLILQDLETCLEYANCKDQNSAVILSALHRALVVTYGKCFAEARKRKIQLNGKEVFKGAPPDLWEYHQLLIANRNEFVAHSGSDTFEDSHVKVVLPPESQPHLQPCMLHAARSLRNFSPQNMELIIRTIEHAREHTKQKMKKCGELIKKEVLILVGKCKEDN